MTHLPPLTPLGHTRVEGDLPLLLALVLITFPRRVVPLVWLLGSGSPLPHHLARMEQRVLTRRQTNVDDRRGAYALLTSAGVSAAWPGHMSSPCVETTSTCFRPAS